jgi:N-methylhydantoinase A
MGDLLIGIDVGGTFTDAIVFDSSNGSLLSAFKVPSSTGEPGKAVIDAIEKIAESVTITDAVVCHGTTVGTNTLIERRGSRTALLSTAGFSDVVALRRQDRPVLYSFDVRISEPLAPRELRFDVPERVAADGSVVRPLDTSGVVQKLRDAGVEAVAISFLHSYVNDAHERAIAAEIEEALPGVFVTRSGDVCPEFREYERSSTTLVNAYLGHTVSQYVSKLDQDVRGRGVKRLMIVKSNGGLTSPENASRYPAHLIESGPAAQLTAAAAFARATGRPNLVAFDMGGTTAKAGVIRNGQPEMVSEFYADRLVDGREVGGYAIRSAVLDLVEIGAGGGSIAWINEANVLKVGPRSAGAIPGPACYSRGGRLPTVTDAHAVIGTLTAELFANSGVRFDREHAIQAVRDHIAEPLGWTVVRAAYAIIDIAVANMADMVRLATTQRGLDPRDFALLASGGAGPLHAAAVGAEIGASEVIVPPYPGMFSALGATLGAIRHEVTQTLLRNLRDLGETDLTSAFSQLTQRVEAILSAEPAGLARPRFERILEARFVGQLFELRVPAGGEGEPLPSLQQVERAFRELYLREYGFELPDAQVQLVNLRLIATIDLGHSGERIFAQHEQGMGTPDPLRMVTILMREGEEAAIPVYAAAEAAGGVIAGPSIIEHAGATVWLHAGQSARIESNGQVIVSLYGDLQ